jgi:endonuclease YncB( thermonuclease family)
MELMNMTKDTPEFSLQGLTLQGKVVELYDADTCKIVLPVQNAFYKFTCRLSGIDTPEMKPLKTKPNREGEIVWAKKARAELLKLICTDDQEVDQGDPVDLKKEEIVTLLEKNKNLITVKCLEFDKYGRLLVELYGKTIDKSFNNMLIEKNMAVAYDGGKKINPWLNP